MPVTLYEMRPVRPTAVHKTDRLAELVCSNSFRGDKLDNAVGLLKEEMRRLGSLVMRAAEASRVPGRRGARRRPRALRRRRSPNRSRRHPLITIVREEVPAIPTSTERDAGDRRHRSADLRRAVGRPGAAGRRASTCISTTRSARSCSPSRSIATKVFRASRWDRICAAFDELGRAIWRSRAGTEPARSRRTARRAASTTARATT